MWILIYFLRFRFSLAIAFQLCCNPDQLQWIAEWNAVAIFAHPSANCLELWGNVDAAMQIYIIVSVFFAKMRNWKFFNKFSKNFSTEIYQFWKSDRLQTFSCCRDHKSVLLKMGPDVKNEQFLIDFHFLRKMWSEFPGNRFLGIKIFWKWKDFFFTSRRFLAKFLDVYVNEREYEKYCAELHFLLLPLSQWTRRLKQKLSN